MALQRRTCPQHLPTLGWIAANGLDLSASVAAFATRYQASGMSSANAIAPDAQSPSGQARLDLCISVKLILL